MSNISENEQVFEDISSSTPASKKTKKKKRKSATVAYGNAGIKHIDVIIKAISFIVCLGVLVIFLAVAAILFWLDEIFTVLAIGVAIVGIVLALISLFLIYGLGHIITQSNEILKRTYK